MSGKAARASKARKRDSRSLYWTRLMLEWGKAWEKAEQAKTALRWPMLAPTMTVTAIDRANRVTDVSFDARAMLKRWVQP